MSQTKIEPQVRTAIFDAAQHPTKPHLFQCSGCRNYFVRTALQIDHKVPEVESTPEQRSDPANLQLLCAPKGSTWINSCHKKKTRQEHQRRARLNKVPYRWTPALIYGSGSIIVTGFTWQEVFRQDHVEAMQWLQWSSLSIGAAFTTYLVQKAWRRRRPRRVIPAEPIPTPRQAALDVSRIEEAFRELVGPKGTVKVAPMGMNHFTISYPKTGFADHLDERRYEALSKIQAKIEGRWKAVWNTQDDLVTFTRRPSLERLVRHPGFGEKRPWHQILIAPGVCIDLMVTPHVLIIGTTGAGKTALMRTMIVGVAESARRDDNARMILADPKRIEMPGFKGWNGVREVISTTEDLWQMAFDLEDEMNHRLELIEAKKAKPSDFRKIICVIDEYEQYFKRMHRHWMTGVDEDGKPLKKGSGKVPPPIDAIQSVLSMARRVNMHLIIGTQSPDANWFGGTGTRENLAGRVAVGPVDQHRARMMFDDSSIGRDIPIEFKGRATVQVGDGEPQEIQCYYTADPFDPDGDNTVEDWENLLMLGMPRENLPDHLKELTCTVPSHAS